MTTFTMYTTPWCGYCHRLQGQLDREGIDYDVVDIEQTPDAVSIVESANNGNQTVPDPGVLRRNRPDEPLDHAGEAEARVARLLNRRVGVSTQSIHAGPVTKSTLTRQNF